MSTSQPEPAHPTAPGDPALRRTVWLSLLADVVLVVAFAAIGRLSHGEQLFGQPGLGLLTTAWPFVVALLVGWAAMRVWRFPLAILGAGVSLWLYTLIGGMLLRVASGSTAEPAFVVVAAVMLATLLIGWRAIAALVRAMRRGAAD